MPGAVPRPEGVGALTVPLPLAILGVLLVFALPGYATTRALFPEWRIRGERALLRAVEIGTLSLITSVGITVLVGFGLLNLSPIGFQASWADPELEVILAAIAALGFGLAAARGSFSRVPPAGQRLETEPDGGWETLREMDRLGLAERRLLRTLQSSPPGSQEERDIRAQLDSIRSKVSELRSRQEAELAT